MRTRDHRKDQDLAGEECRYCGEEISEEQPFGFWVCAGMVAYSSDERRFCEYAPDFLHARRPARDIVTGQPLWPAAEVVARPHYHCLYCGQRIADGLFCTGTHSNLFIAEYGSPGEASECRKHCRGGSS